MIKMRISLWCLLIAVACCLVSPLAVFAQENQAAEAEESAPAPKPADPRMETEITYIKALVENGYADLAGPVIENCRKRWPDSVARIAALEMAAELRLGHFDTVIATIAKELDKKSSKYWAMNLALADAYFAQSKTVECEKIYKKFFEEVKSPKDDIRVLFIESSFRWAQMLIMQHKDAEASLAYDALMNQLRGRENKDLWLTVATENAQLLLKLAVNAPENERKGYLDRADKIIGKLLWEQERILIFGRAVAMKSHVYLLRGKLATAQRTVEEFFPQLKEIHESLLEQDPTGSLGYLRQSPMPECRYLLAKMLWDEVQKEIQKPADPKVNETILTMIFGEKKGGKRTGTGAYNHAVNVFVKYPESTWASAAGDMCEAIERFVKERFNKEIKTTVTAAQKKKVREMQFLQATEAFRNNNFADAIPAFQKVLSQFPEVPESVSALGNLAICYLNEALKAKNNKDDQKVEEIGIDVAAIEMQIAERFALFESSYQTAAGDQLLRLASTEHDMGSRARSERLYDLYFENYPMHYQAAQKLAQFASKAAELENWEKAEHYYRIICTSYTNSPYYLSAVQQMAKAHRELGNQAERIVWLKKAVEVSKKPSEIAAAQFNYAYAIYGEGKRMLMEQRAAKDAASKQDASAADAPGDAEAAPAVNPEAERTAMKHLVYAAKEFTKLAAMADAASTNRLIGAEDKARFLELQERAMMMVGTSLLYMPAGSTKQDPRLTAADKLELYLEKFPKGQFAPYILSRLGGIYAATGKSELQSRAFARLERDFPDSQEAKNSKPSLAKTLIEMGNRLEGVKQYAEMINTDGKYTMYQFRDAGDALLEAGSRDAMETAITAYEKAIKLAGEGTNNLAVSSKSQLGKAKALYNLNRLVEAQEILEKFIADPVLSKTVLMVDANMILMDVASRAGSREKDDDLRAKAFGTAIGALKKVRSKAGKDKRKTDELDLMLGDILKRRMEAEKDMGLEAQAQDSMGLALTSFNVFVMAHRPESAEEIAAQKQLDPEYKGFTLDTMTGWQIANLQRAYASLLPLMVEKKFDSKEDAKENAELAIKYAKEYLEWFPEGKHRVLVQNMMNQANAQL